MNLHLSPGSLGNEAIDVQTLTDWGVDYVKYCGCGDFPPEWQDGPVSLLCSSQFLSPIHYLLCRKLRLVIGSA